MGDTLSVLDGSLHRGNVPGVARGQLLGDSTFDPLTGEIYLATSTGELSFDPSTDRVEPESSYAGVGTVSLFVAATGLLYLDRAGTVEVIDPSNGTLARSVDLGESGSTGARVPLLLWDPAVPALLVSGVGGNGPIVELNVSSFRATNLSSNANPVVMAFDPELGDVVVVTANETLLLVNASTGATVGPTSVAANGCAASAAFSPAGLAIDPTNGTAYVTESTYASPSCLVEVDLAARSVVRSTSMGPGAGGVAYDPTLDRVIVADTANRSISEFAASTLREISSVVLAGSASFPGATGLLWQIDLVPALGAVFVPVALGSQIVSIDAANLTIFARTFTEAEIRGIVFDPSTNAYVALDYTNARLIDIDPANFSVRGATSLVGPPLAGVFDRVGNQLCVVIDGVYSSNGGVECVNATTGVELASVYVATLPEGIAVDPSTGTIYFSENLADAVGAIGPVNHTLYATYPTGSRPWGVAADPMDGLLFIANAGGTNVTVVNLTTHRTAASISTGGPFSILWDPYDDRVYAANEFGGNITPIDPTTLRATGSLALPSPGEYPSDLAANASSPLLYVANGAANVTIFNLTSKAATLVSVGNYTAAIAAGTSDDVVVGDWDSTLADLVLAPRLLLDNASFRLGPISAPVRTTVLLSTNVTGGSTPLSYNYSGLPRGCLSSNRSTLPCVPTVPGRFGIVATVQDTGGRNVSLRAFLWVYEAVTLNVSETGGPPGAVWSATVGGVSNMSNGTYLDFRLQPGTYAYSIGPPVGFGATPASGQVVVPSSNVSLAIDFVRLYGLSFHETGLRGGTSWSVLVNGTALAGSTASLSDVLSNGTYSYAVPTVAGYAVDTPNGTVPIAGSNVTVPVEFSELFPLQFIESGLPSAVVWSVVVSGTRFSVSGVGLDLQRPNGSYAWSVGIVAGYSSSPSSGSAIVAGAVRTVLIDFSASATPTYPLEFTETGLANSTVWSVSLASPPGSGGPKLPTLSGQGTTLAVNEPNDTYDFVIGNVSGFSAQPSSGVVTISGSSRSIPIVFVPQSIHHGPVVEYDILFTESGLSGGIVWSVTLSGTAHSSSTTYLNVFLPNGSYEYAPGAVAGYVAPGGGVITVNGGAETIPLPYAVQQGPVGASHPGPLPGFVWVVVPVLAIVAGVALLLLVRARRKVSAPRTGDAGSPDPEGPADDLDAEFGR